LQQTTACETRTGSFELAHARGKVGGYAQARGNEVRGTRDREGGLESHLISTLRSSNVAEDSPLANTGAANRHELANSTRFNTAWTKREENNKTVTKKSMFGKQSEQMY
jgi:hypothetical protein